MFESVYGLRNRRLYSKDELLLRVFEEAAILEEIQRKETTVGIETAMAHFFGWLIAFCNSQGIDLQSAVFSKYHGICPYCGKYQHCICIAAETKPRVWRRDENAKPPATLSKWQEMFERIFGRVNRVAGIDKCWKHLYEELGEVSRACRLKERKNLRHELADVFAWLMAVCNHLGLALDDVVLGSYPEQCDVCKRRKCRCPKV